MTNWYFAGYERVPRHVAAAPAAPTLTLISGATDNTPDFTLTGDLVVGDTIRFQYSTDSGFSGASEITNTIDAGEDAANELDFSTGSLADGTWYFRARIERSGDTSSAWSNTQTETIDTTAPTLSSPSGTKTGTTTADGSVSTNEGNGTVYRVTDSGSTPTKAQVKAGQGSGGSAADGSSASAAVVATGVQTLNATALTPGTTYRHYFMHEDAVGNQSGVSASSTFTTDSAGAFHVVQSQALDTDQGSLENFTLVNFYKAGVLSHNGSQVRLRLVPPSVGNDTHISSMYIGHAAAAGDPYDFETTPVQVKVSGNGAFTLTAGGAAVVTDAAVFNLDITKNLLVAYGTVGAASTGRIKTGLIVTDYILYFLGGGADDAATVNKSGYSNVTGQLFIIDQIEAFY